MNHGFAGESATNAFRRAPKNFYGARKPKQNEQIPQNTKERIRNLSGIRTDARLKA
jgi:hypothetical protein